MIIANCKLQIANCKLEILVGRDKHVKRAPAHHDFRLVDGRWACASDPVARIPWVSSLVPPIASAAHLVQFAICNLQFAICNFLLCFALGVTSGCDMLDMYDEPRFEPLEASTFFDDGTSARPLVAGTVARGDLRDDEALYSGKLDGKYVTELPVELTRALLMRGEERFNIYCSPCHGRVGDGNGMIVQRGFRRPPSFVSTDRLLNAPLGHFYDVISNGFGAMPSYASRVEPHDRWAIVAYIRALQRSQNGSIDDVPEELRDKVSESVAIEEQERENREEAERLDTQRQRKLERDIREHRVPPQEGERRHEEYRRKETGGRSSLQSLPKHREAERGRVGEREMFGNAVCYRLRVLRPSPSRSRPVSHSVSQAKQHGGAA
jgi:mono/diheme cytochrome c family protein